MSIRVSDVLMMLRPDGGWTVSGNTWEGVNFIDAEPLTKAEYEKGLIDYPAWKAEQDATKAAEKQAILDRLGITETEVKLLLG